MAQDCIAIMREAAPDLSDREIDQLVTELRNTKRAREAPGIADGLQDEAMAAAEEVANNLKIAAVIEKRNAALNFKARAKAEQFVTGQFKKTAAGQREGLFAIIAG